MLRDRTDKAWFSRLLRHPTRKRSGSILTTPEPARGTHFSKKKFAECKSGALYHRATAPLNTHKHVLRKHVL